MRTNINNVDTSSTDFKVGFFGIKPNERALVRILIDSEDDFDVVTLHSVETAEGKTIRVDCIRDPRQSVDVCPLCADGAKVEQRVYLKMLQYVQDEVTGQMVPKAKIWDRSVKSDLITSLRTYLNDYGPLSDIVCSITRTGAGLDTTYTVSPNLPHPEMYVKDVSAFEDYDVVGTVVKSWDASQMNEFILTGVVPAKKSAENTQTDSYAGAVPARQAFAPEQPGFDSNGMPVWSTQQPVAPAPTNIQPGPAVSYQQPAPAVEGTRPRRVYN